MKDTLDGFQGVLQIGGQIVTNIHPVGHFRSRTTGAGGAHYISETVQDRDIVL